ncbi:MAG: rhomboid family intramembrane serine protease [Halobacteriales archaeon SW_9_67_25]|nr:MAG: rhomboid family intramembrane serine protease [Halobacteriales archaeon SW_9_67_25]
MATLPEGGLLEAVSLWALAGAVLFSAYVLVRVRTERRPLDRLRGRLILGVPWGTAIVVATLLVVYYVVQGTSDLGQPVVVGFRSWSYSYPLGMVFGPFSHSSDSHIVGNLVSTVAFAPIAEYAWSHYPTERGSHSFGSWSENPFVRVAVFVAAVFVVGLATSFMIPGALIGFSGVVFAFGGFVLVTRPVAGIAALVVERVVRLTYFSLDNPVLTARGRTQFVTPYWADVAVQGHALGLLLGVLVGLVAVRWRGEWPGVGRVWLAVLVYGVAKSLWAVYWYLGGTEYVLFRGAGLALVFLLAGLVAVSLADRDAPLVARIDLSRREAAAGLLIAGVLALGLAAVPYNTVAVSPGPAADTGVEVRDYTVTYVEDVPNRYIGAVKVPVVRDAFTVNTSGVVVASDRRDAWEVVVPAQRLKVRGRVTVPVGGVGWRETVVVNRTTWSMIDGSGTYRVHIRPPDGPRKQVYAADPAVSPVVLNDSRIAIRPAESGYELAVRRNDTVVGTATVPGGGRNGTVAGIQFNRTGDRLRAIHDGTRVPIAKFELQVQRDRP